MRRFPAIVRRAGADRGCPKAAAGEFGHLEKLIDLILNLDGRIGDALRRRRLWAVPGHPGQMHVHEDGSLRVLRLVASGGPVPPALAAGVRSRFCGHDPELAAAPEAVRRDAGRTRMRLTLDAALFVEHVIPDRTTVRERLRALLQTPAPDAADRADPADLVARIEALNGRFRDLEARLRPWAWRGGMFVAAWLAGRAQPRSPQAFTAEKSSMPSGAPPRRSRSASAARAGSRCRRWHGRCP